MIDLKKPYMTRGRKAVRLISDQGTKALPIIGLIGDETFPTAWESTGKHISNLDEFDLIEVKTKPRKIKVSGWVNVDRKGNMGMAYRTKEMADYQASNRVACKYVEFECEEGEGLWKSDTVSIKGEVK